uniref:Sushi, von Willebrand factor type A, EGF and pentraxin domain-containing protein 1 n=1 Tax=Sphaerodactylus townsendi TaxID=933632 RepID=A0ACB8ES77_9SAUR
MWPLLSVLLWGGVWGWAPPQSAALYRPLNWSSLAALPPLLLLQPPPPPGLPAGAAEGKVAKLGRLFKRQVRRLRERSGRLELVFLVDESSSVGAANFRSELRFVKKLLSDFPVVPAATRVAIVTFSSKHNVVPRVDYISPPARPRQHKCALLGREIPAIGYRGGGTYTKGAFQQAASGT